MSRLRPLIILMLLSGSVAASGCGYVFSQLVEPFYRAVRPQPHLVYGPEDAARWVAEARRSWMWPDEEMPEDDVLLGEQMGIMLHEGSLQEIWLPSRRQVAHIRRLLYQRLEDDRVQPDWDYPGTLNQYTVRYIGIVYKGKRCIYVVGDWGRPGNPKRWPIILDGGTGVFHALYDPATRTLVGFNYNGEA